MFTSTREDHMSTFMFAIVFLFGLGQDDLNKLGSADYKTRHITHEKLAKRMNLDLYLQIKNTKFTDLEAKRRAQAIMEDYEGQIDFKTYQQVRGMKEFIKLEENYKQRMLARWMVTPRNYPAYPWLYSLPREYQWNGWGAYQIERFYLGKAQRMMAVGCSPFWNDYRLATRMWVFTRIEQGIEHASNGTEGEFNASMEKLTEEIHRDLHHLIQQEGLWWAMYRQANPLRLHTLEDE